MNGEKDKRQNDTDETSGERQSDGRVRETRARERKRIRTGKRDEHEAQTEGAAQRDKQQTETERESGKERKVGRAGATSGKERQATE